MIGTEEPPVKEGEIIEAKITSMGRKGDGIAKYKKFIIVIPRAKLKRTYKVKITNIHESFAFAIIQD